MKLKVFIAALAVGLGSTANLQAAVSEQDAAQLGNELTPTGANSTGNADGSIPPWTGGGVDKVPDGFDPEKGLYSNPFADDEILYTITHENMGEYTSVLSEGQQAMLKRLGPDGYKINVYPSRRTFAAPQWYYDGTRANATRAALEDDGQRIAGNVAGVPFPMPQNGLEALWNHMIRWMGYEWAQANATYYVDSKGDAILASSTDTYWEFPMFMPFKDAGRKYDSNILRWAFLRSNFTAPSRRAGEILLIHEPGADYTAGKGRSAWQYLKGQRRVRKAPSVSFDTPRRASAGTSTYDDTYVFNGSPERYDWKLLGKRELIVPYNNYEAIFNRETPEMLGEKFIKPEFIRFEKHRVWIVEGTLKEGLRHIYSKRRILIDEDSWHGLENMRWDNEGTLWRTGFSLQAMVWDIPAPQATSEMNYDLVSGIFNITGKPAPGSLRSENGKPPQFFTPQGMARSGIR
ncbi:DUF1329 domain-containing protein [Pseudohalioglobus lutimaris]|uniref:DUF1329 domain-containing protein n=1 Tax=Pseudohalioglobus lutimaris TaxID=1737061 RepID=A0A2N5X5T0_9GAMM|nr:DUF1329 domain-containing protein [Pseudohalioglobus lutimaris]PLW69849.1 DUF1329 domain-containing protein [Pseudohalioglobus lutimaris]